jgi:hypothetical protein
MYVYLPAVNTRGCILVAWRASVWVTSGLPTRLFSVLVKLHHVDGGPDWWLTSVYGPAADVDKDSFLAELHDLHQVRTGPWMINDDFNLIYRVEDKNNDKLNRHRMEIHLNRRLFTWSNERAHLTLERIDRVFISNEWDSIFPDHMIHSLSSLCSDQAPLLLHTEDVIQAKSQYHFRSFWPRLLGFLDMVARAWHCPLGNVSPFMRLDTQHSQVLEKLE